MNSPLPHSITLPWHPYLPPPSISTLAVCHLVLSARLPVIVCVHACKRLCVHAPVCLHTCEPKCISTFTVMEWSEVDTGYRALRCENTLCGSSVFNWNPALCLEAWNAGNHSQWRDSGSFFIWVYSGTSALPFPSNLSDWFPFNSVSILFSLSSLSGLRAFPLPLSSPDGFASHPICPPANMREPLSLGGNQSVLSNSPTSFWLWEKWSFLYVSHTHENGPCCAVPLLPKAAVMHFRFILNFFCLFSLALYDPWLQKESEHTLRTNKMYLTAVQTRYIELSGDLFLTEILASTP